MDFIMRQNCLYGLSAHLFFDEFVVASAMWAELLKLIPKSKTSYILEHREYILILFDGAMP
jgi:hypothetical protein